MGLREFKEDTAHIPGEIVWCGVRVVGTVLALVDGVRYKLRRWLS